MTDFVIANASDRATTSGHWMWYFWVILGAIITSLGCLVGYLVYLWYLSGYYVLASYITYIVFILILFGSMSFFFDKGTHFHHYVTAMILASLCGHHNIIVCCFNGLFCGAFVEGCARWSVAPNWRIGMKYVNGDIKKLIEGGSSEELIAI